MDLYRRFDLAAGSLILLVLLLTVYMTREFFSTMLFCVVLSFLLRPAYDLGLRLTGHRQISSILSLMIMLALILLVLLSLTTVLMAEVSRIEISGVFNDLSFSAIPDEIALLAEGILPPWAYQYYQYAEDIAYRYVEEIGGIPAAFASWALPVVETEMASFASNLPVLFAQAIVALFFTYYLLIDGGTFVERVVSFLPDRKQGVVTHFLEELNSIYTTLFTVYFTTSMLSGLFAAIGFSLLGVPYPFLLGALVAVFTLVPLLGPPFVFLPLSLYYLLDGNPVLSVVILVFGTVFLMVIPENVIRPHLAMKSARIHPIITVLAYTAPIFVVGIIGVIVGPTLYGFLLAAYRTVEHYRGI